MRLDFELLSWRRITLTAVSALLSIAGCDAGDEDAKAVEVLESTVERQVVPLDPAVQSELSVDHQAFAFDIYHQIRTTPGNLFYSPYSISTALAMAYVGAAGQTKAEMKEVLHFELEDEALHAAFNALDRELDTRPIEGTEESPGLKLEVANTLWASQQEKYRPYPTYVDALALNYDAPVRLVDFEADPKAARQAINAVVAEQTYDLIPALLPDGVISTLTRVVLTNAMYFKAGWASPFEESSTIPLAMFTDVDGGSHFVDQMNGLFEIPYANTDRFAAIRLPFVGHDIVMTLVLPHEGAFAEVEASLDPEFVANLSESFARTGVRVAIPKFSTRSPFLLSPVLQALGMQDAFMPGVADFSALSPLSLFIKEVVHEGFITVDEVGTEAGAATAVVFDDESEGPYEEASFIADRPFLYWIEDLPTSTPLFVGRFSSP